jgi:hypothetical protein
MIRSTTACIQADGEIGRLNRSATSLWTYNARAVIGTSALAVLVLVASPGASLGWRVGHLAGRALVRKHDGRRVGSNTCSGHRVGGIGPYCVARRLLECPQVATHACRRQHMDLPPVDIAMKQMMGASAFRRPRGKTTLAAIPSSAPGGACVWSWLLSGSGHGHHLPSSIRSTTGPHGRLSDERSQRALCAMGRARLLHSSRKISEVLHTRLAYRGLRFSQVRGGPPGVDRGRLSNPMPGFAGEYGSPNRNRLS